MHHAHRVQELDTGDEVAEIWPPEGWMQTFLDFVEKTTCSEFHVDVQEVVVRAGVVELDDVGMFQLLVDSHFVLHGFNLIGAQGCQIAFFASELQLRHCVDDVEDSAESSIRYEFDNVAATDLLSDLETRSR